MKITIESTSKIVELTDEKSGGTLPARLWEGETESGIKVHCFITRIAADRDEDLQQFDAELLEQRTPSRAMKGYDLRLIL